LVKKNGKIKKSEFFSKAMNKSKIIIENFYFDKKNDKKKRKKLTIANK